jgi:hypothetical protein
MQTYVLNKKPEPVEMVWAFDLGHPLRLERGEERGEVSNPANQKNEANPASRFLHKASLLIPAEFWKIKMGLFRLRGSPKSRSYGVCESCGTEVRPLTNYPLARPAGFDLGAIKN